MHAITRKEAIERLVDGLVEVYEQQHGFVREVLHKGRIGFDAMTNSNLEVAMENLSGLSYTVTA